MVPTASVAKVSCLLPTTNRFHLLQQSVRCFCRQTYPNKELIIVSNGTSAYQQLVGAWVGSLNRDDLFCVFVEGAHWNLGMLRNLSIDRACGEILCQWDEDDLSHPERVERQADALLRQEAESCYLASHLHFFHDRRELYWLDWATHPGPLKTPALPGTMMCRRSAPARYPEQGPDAHRFEDMRFLAELRGCGAMATLADEPYLYVYSFHGSNLNSFDHHWGLAQRKGMSADFLRIRRRLLEDNLNRYEWNETEIRVCGPDGLAFVFRPPEENGDCNLKQEVCHAGHRG